MKLRTTRGRVVSLDEKEYKVPLFQRDGQISAFALVDEADFFRVLNAGSWSASPSKHTVYAHLSNGITMHRLVTGAGAGDEVDHKNGNGLDNRKSNLRFCSRSQNQQNKAKTAGCASRYKGVSRSKNRKAVSNWRACISPKLDLTSKGRAKQVTLGYFLTEEEAAFAYDLAAVALFGEFSRINGVRLQESKEEIVSKRVNKALQKFCGVSAGGEK